MEGEESLGERPAQAEHARSQPAHLPPPFFQCVRAGWRCAEARREGGAAPLRARTTAMLLHPLPARQRTCASLETPDTPR